MLTKEDAGVLYLQLRKNESIRILHKGCSEGKDPCMVVTKKTDCIKFLCHRCNVGGTVDMTARTPEQTLKAFKEIEARKLEEVDHTKEVKVLTLPKDIIPLSDKDTPFKARKWFYDVGLKGSECSVFWSPFYNRVIFPINVDGLLLGWVGRNVDGEKPKYLTRKREGSNRLLYVSYPLVIPSISNDKGKGILVFTEDILSALKVTKNMRCTAIALLTTHIDQEVLNRYQYHGVKNYLWLDGDMKAKSIQKASRLRQLGYNIKSILTDKDPKYYNQEEMKGIFGV